MRETARLCRCMWLSAGQCRYMCRALCRYRCFVIPGYIVIGVTRYVVIGVSSGLSKHGDKIPGNVIQTKCDSARQQKLTVLHEFLLSCQILQHTPYCHTTLPALKVWTCNSPQQPHNLESKSVTRHPGYVVICVVRYVVVGVWSLPAMSLYVSRPML